MSDFPELVRLRNDIKPLSQLWEAISQFKPAAGAAAAIEKSQEPRAKIQEP